MLAMNLKLKISLALYIANIFIMTIIGLAFVFKGEFMPFHSDVIETSWQALNTKSQILYLGMMRTEGAGFLASATALSFILFIPFLKFEQWAPWAMTSIGIVEYLPTLLANYHVSSITNASPPWLFMLLLSLSLLIALFFATIGHTEINNNNKT